VSRYAFDLDGVLVQWNSTFAKLLIKQTKEDRLPIDYVNDPAFPKEWSWPEAVGYSELQIAEAWETVNNSNCFWEDLDPLPGAARVLTRLADLAKDGHEIYFLTYRTGKTCKLQTERWLDYHGMIYPTVIVCQGKGMILKSLKIDVAIDDHLPTANEVARHGMVGRMYLKSAPYNLEGREKNLIIVNSVKEMLEKEGLYD
jgi:hypothetical protein